VYSVVEDSIDDGHLCAVEIFSPQFFFWKAGERVFNIAGDCGINRTGVAPKIRKNSVIKPVAPVANPPNESGDLSPPDLFLQRHSLAMGKRKSKAN